MMQSASFPEHEIPLEEHIHWQEYARVFWERKWITVITLLSVVLVALIANLKAVPIYQTFARIEVESTSMKLLNFQDLVSREGNDQDMATQVRILQSRSLAERVVKALDLKHNPKFMPGAGPNDDFAGAVQGCLNVQLVRGTGLIDIIAEHPNPEIAALVANGVAQEFIRQRIERKMAASLEAVKWLAEQLAEYKTKLEKSEAAVQEYREKTGMALSSELANVEYEKLRDMQNTVTKAKSDRVSAETAWKQVKAALDSDQDLTTVPVIASHAEVSALRVQLTQKQIAVSVLRERYKEKYPTMVTALKELSEIQEKLKKACTVAMETLKSDYAAAQAKEEGLRQALTDQEKQSVELGRKLLDYNVLKRNADSDRQLFESIMTRVKEAGVAGKFEGNNVRIVDSALVPGGPCRPDKRRNMMLAAILGLVAGLGLSFVAHMYDDKIKSYSDVESYLGLPMLCEVPHIDLPDDGMKARVTFVDPQSMAAEAFCGVRASLGLIPSSKDARVILVTSTAPGEGKSLVASNLAIAFARDNTRTLLLDANLRRPSIAQYFNITSDLGLSRYLTTGATPEVVIWKTEVENLDVAVAGQVPENPAELLGSARMRDLLHEASNIYDRIIIDCSPVAIASDPIVLLPRVQGVIFVTHFSKIRRDNVARAVKRLREVKAPLIGIVLNNIDVEKHGLYFSYRDSHYYNPKTGSRASMPRVNVEAQGPRT